jgi:transcriptional regulator with XRE-family HTH domain
MDAAAVAERVRKAREARGWSQRALDRASGLSHGYVSKLEAGQIPNYSVSQLRKIAGSLGVAVEELIGAGSQGDDGQSRGGETGDEKLDAALEEIRVNLMALGRLDSEAVSSLRGIVAAMKENAERRRKEERRAERRRQKDTESPR